MWFIFILCNLELRRVFDFIYFLCSALINCCSLNIRDSEVAWRFSSYNLTFIILLFQFCGQETPLPIKTTRCSAQEMRTTTIQLMGTALAGLREGWGFLLLSEQYLPPRFPFKACCQALLVALERTTLFAESLRNENHRR